MSKRSEPFEYRRVRYVWTDRAVRKLVRAGWEIVGQSQAWSTITVSLRRPNPRYRGAKR